MRVSLPGLVSLSAAFAAWMLLALPAMAQPVAAVAADVREAVDAGDAVPVIVGVDASFVPESLLTGAALQVQRRAVAQATGRAMGQAAIAGAIIGPSLGALPYFSARIDSRSLDRLAAMPGVRRIDLDAIVTPSLLSSLPLIHAASAWSAGYEGTGWTVAILDTGVQLDHPFLAGRIVGEACYSTGGGLAGTSLCPGGVTSSTLTGSGGACSGVSGCEHGTHVAGIAAGFNAPDGSHGVARGASIISMQVFTRFTTVADCGGAPPCLGAFTSDIVRGLDRVAALAGPGNASRIAAANLSLGGGWSTVTCDDASPETTAAVQALRLLGIATVVASGNNGYANALSWPACISTAVSVGSVTDAPAVSGFSNNAPFLSLYAPGSLIRSSVTGSAYGDLSGTSMAAPHVAGAWAVLKQARPAASVGDILATLQSTGTTIADTRVGGGTPHPLINVEAARAQLADVSINTVRWEPEAAGAQLAVAVSTRTSGAGWVAASDAHWLLVSTSGGSGNGTLTLTAAPVSAVTSRQARVTVGEAVMTVTQYGATLGISAWSPAGAGGAQAVPVTMVAEHLGWTATTTEAWLTATPSSGTGSGTVMLTAASRSDSAQPRTARATIAGRTVTVTQAGVVPTFVLAVTDWPVGAGGGTTTAALSVSPADAAWTTSSNATWLVVNPPSGTGAATVSLTAAASTSAFPRTGTAVVAGQAITVTQAAGVNTFTTSLPASWAPSAAGGTLGPLTVDATLSDAPWTATSSAPWVTVTPASGLGSGAVTLTAAANASVQPRTATVTVAGQTVTVTQAGGVNTFTVSPITWAVAVGGGTRSLSVSASLSDAPWTAASDATWLTLSASGGTGSGAVTLTAAANPSVHARTGTVTLAGQTVTVTQAGGVNTFTVSPLSWNAPDRGEERVLNIAATYGDAPWTATAHVPWLIVGQASGNGPLSMSVMVVQNTGPERIGTLTVAGQTVTVTQATGLRTIAVTAATVSLSAGGGTSVMTVTASHPDVGWSATSEVAWLTPSVVGGLGSGTVVFTAGANPSVQSRSGTVTVGGQAFVLTQAGAVPTFTLGSPSWNVPRSGGRYEVTLTSSVADAPWTATTTVPWLTVTPASGVGTTTVTVVAARMPGVATRVGDVLIGGASLAVTQSAPANQPIDVTVTSIDQQVVTLRWVWSGPPPDSYLLVGGPVPGSEAGSFQTGTAEPMATFTVPRGTFYVCVIGIRNGERLLPSEDVRLSVEVPEAPSAPARLLGLANGRALELTWVNTRAAGAPTASVLEVSGTVSGVLSLPLSERFSFPDVPDGTYTFRVRAANGSGVSPASDALTMTFPGACQRPDVPESFQAYATGRTVTLRWAPPLSGAAATGYLLRVSGTLAGELLLAGRDLVTGAPPGTYVVTVSAVNACGTGPATGPVTVTVP